MAQEGHILSSLEWEAAHHLNTFYQLVSFSGSDSLRNKDSHTVCQEADKAHYKS